jgi:hypothetical protein
MTFLAELSKTVRMFKEVLPKLKSYVLRAQKFDTAEMANLWLQGRYGWRTLIYDINSIEQAITHLDKESGFWETRKGQSVTITDSWYGLRSTINNVLRCDTELSVDVSYRAIARGKVKPPSFGGNLLTTSWELLPYSFVVDWFLDIGSKIELISSALTNPSDVSHYGIKITANSLSQSSIEEANTPANSAFVFTVNDASAEISSTLVKRAPYDPSFIPNWQVNLDTYKVADIAALIYQGIKR